MTESPQPSSGHSGDMGYPIRERILVTICAIGATLIETVDSTVVNVGLPKMMGGLDATVDEVAWIITAYSIGNILMIPMTRFFADKIGRKVYFTGSVFFFAVFSFFCAQSTSLPELVIFRMFQGVSGAAFFATSQALLIEAYPSRLVGLANALFAIGISLGPAIGPVIGGYIAYNLSWPWMFYINVPIGIVLTALSYKVIRNSPYTNHGETADVWGILLLAMGIPALQIFLENGQEFAWFDSPLIRASFWIAVISLPLFVVRQFVAKHPLIDLRVLKNRSLAAGCFGLFFLGIVYFGTLFTVPLMGQILLGWNPYKMGLVLLPGILSFTFTAMFVGGAMGKAPLLPIMFSGMGILLLSLHGLSNLSIQIGPDAVFWPLIERGVGLACLFPPIMTLAMSTLSREKVSSGAALVSMMGQVGGTVGIAFMTTMLERFEQQHRSDLSEHLSNAAPLFEQHSQMLTSTFIAHGVSPQAAGPLSFALMNQTLDAQAMMLSFGNLYLLTSISCLLLLFAIFGFERSAISHPQKTVQAD
ncbi:MAG: DHA2 family efflux MFS transporter permease subunit [Nitrospiraceae bacterium]|nr:DHA2 family efflux MFS transporter permease subunit [Nitrospiraceae bacterium]